MKRVVMGEYLRNLCTKVDGKCGDVEEPAPPDRTQNSESSVVSPYSGGLISLRDLFSTQKCDPLPHDDPVTDEEPFSLEMIVVERSCSCLVVKMRSRMSKNNIFIRKFLEEGGYEQTESRGIMRKYYSRTKCVIMTILKREIILNGRFSSSEALRLMDFRFDVMSIRLTDEVYIVKHNLTQSHINHIIERNNGSSSIQCGLRMLSIGISSAVLRGYDEHVTIVHVANIVNNLLGEE